VLREALGAGDVWLHGGSAAVAVRRAGQEERIALCHSKEPDSERWPRLVPHPVLIGHAASLTPY